MAMYSDSRVEGEAVACCLDCQSTIESPTLKIYPVIEHLESRQPARSASTQPSKLSQCYAKVTTETSTSLSRRTKVPPPPMTVADRLNSLSFLSTSPCPPVSLQSSRHLPVSLELSIHALVSMFTTSSGPIRYMSQQYEKDDFPQKINTVVFSYLVPVPLPLSTSQTFQRLKVASVSH
ncbi:hypothetical protein AYX14_07010 [Cryptococcus neoformans]|nr:hypothetical protein AYX14_07010 [Cryptococcus neoformans var. grubii]